MACSLVVDGSNYCWILRVAANILNKRSGPSDKGWCSGLETGRRTESLTAEKTWRVTKCPTESRIWTYFLHDLAAKVGMRFELDVRGLYRQANVHQQDN